MTNLELDRKMAEEVMGWIIEPHCPDMWVIKYGPHNIRCMSHVKDWHPSTNIAQALGDGGPGTVVGKMLTKGWFLEMFYSQPDALKWENNVPSEADCYVRFYVYPKGDERLEEMECVVEKAPSLAICLAAAKALVVVGGEQTHFPGCDCVECDHD